MTVKAGQPVNLLSPPTDNLYKFIAISGLIISIFSIYLPLQGLRTWGEQGRPYWSAVAAISVDKRFLQDDEADYDRKHEQNAVVLASFVERQRDLYRRQALLSGEETLVKSDQLLEHTLMHAMWGFFVSGLIIASLGFFLWGLKLQKYQDKAASLNPVTGKPFNKTSRLQPKSPRLKLSKGRI